MLKKVDASQLKVGMYIHDLSCDWMTHPFVRNRFLLSSEEEIRKIISAGIHDVVIDNEKGLDVQDAPTLDEAQAATEREIVEIATKSPIVTRVSLGEEMQRAVQIRHQAATLVRTVMQDARLGKAIAVDQVAPVVQNITESILRNPGALMSLLRIKSADDYTFLHSVSVCTLLVAFAPGASTDDGAPPPGSTAPRFRSPSPATPPRAPRRAPSRCPRTGRARCMSWRCAKAARRRPPPRSKRIPGRSHLRRSRYPAPTASRLPGWITRSTIFMPCSRAAAKTAWARSLLTT